MNNTKLKKITLIGVGDGAQVNVIYMNHTPPTAYGIPLIIYSNLGLGAWIIYIPNSNYNRHR